MLLGLASEFQGTLKFRDSSPRIVVQFFGLTPLKLGLNKNPQVPLPSRLYQGLHLALNRLDTGMNA